VISPKKSTLFIFFWNFTILYLEKKSLPDCKCTIISLTRFTKRELNHRKQFLNNINFNSRLVKLLTVRERIVNLQSGNKYLFQIRDC